MSSLVSIIVSAVLSFLFILPSGTTQEGRGSQASEEGSYVWFYDQINAGISGRDRRVGGPGRIVGRAWCVREPRLYPQVIYSYRACFSEELTNELSGNHIFHECFYKKA